MIVQHGSRVPRGFMPVYSVADSAEARRLLVMACSTNIQGDFIARELADVQNLTTLAAFSNRLHEAHERLQASGGCRCVHD